MGEAGAGARRVEVRPMAAGDWAWLTRAGLAPELAGTQYHWIEAPLQVVIAPSRGLGLRSGPRCIVEVDGQWAGYVGRNPLSGNLEYFLAPWARGGTGVPAIAAFLRDHRHGDGERAFFVSHRNRRSLRALEHALEAAGLAEGRDWWIDDGPHGWRITLHATPPKAPGAAQDRA